MKNFRKNSQPSFTFVDRVFLFISHSFLLVCSSNIDSPLTPNDVFSPVCWHCLFILLLNRRHGKFRKVKWNKIELKYEKLKFSSIFFCFFLQISSKFFSKLDDIHVNVMIAWIKGDEELNEFWLGWREKRKSKRKSWRNRAEQFRWINSFHVVDYGQLMIFLEYFLCKHTS